MRRTDAQIRAEISALDRLLALVESYPALTADTSFTRLRAELVDTEQRVALARSFYNNSVQTLHDRAHAFPGVVVARLFGLDLRAEFLTGATDHEASAADAAAPVRPRFGAPERTPPIRQG